MSGMCHMLMHPDACVLFIFLSAVQTLFLSFSVYTDNAWFLFWSM